MKGLIWVGDTLKVIKGFPEAVKDEFGYALHVVQEGGVPRTAKILKGFRPTVVEIVSNFKNDTFRTVYTVKLEGGCMCCIASRKNQRAVLKHLNRILS